AAQDACEHERRRDVDRETGELSHVVFASRKLVLDQTATCQTLDAQIGIAAVAGFAASLRVSRARCAAGATAAGAPGTTIGRAAAAAVGRRRAAGSRAAGAARAVGSARAAGTGGGRRARAMDLAR